MRGRAEKIDTARLKARCCARCVHAGRPPKTRLLRDMMTGWSGLLLCVNHPKSPGTLTDVAPTGLCRNFRARREPPERPAPPAPPNDAIAYIPLTKNLWATVDADKFEWLNGFRWHATGTRGRYYAATVIDGKSIAMHRLLMNPPPGMIVDHIDGNSLNDLVANLRICTPAENRHNTRPLGKSSPYVGVRPHGDKWRARITVDGENLFLGDFDTALEAAKARDAAARRHHGPYAWINVPQGDEPAAADPPKEGDKPDKQPGPHPPIPF
jgi:hypothetical protein